MKQYFKLEDVVEKKEQEITILTIWKSFHKYDVKGCNLNILISLISWMEAEHIIIIQHSPFSK